MIHSKVRIKLAAAAVGALLLPGAALAHHGWAWTEDAESRIEGTLVSLSLGNPHASLELEAADGLWQVDLAPPSATSRAGFVDGVAAPGDAVSVTGHRSRDPAERLFKAETVTVNGQTFDVYPSREKTLAPGA